MKHVFTCLLILVLLVNTKAQQTEGTIIYQRKQNMHKALNNESLKAFMPEFRTSQHQVLFGNNTSLYKLLPEDELPEATPVGGGNGSFVIRTSGGGNTEIYKDFTNNTKISFKEFLSNNYLISDNINATFGWKLTDETKVILGFTCRKAIMKSKAKTVRTMSFSTSTNGETKDSTIKKVDDNPKKEKEIDIVAWYTEAISLPLGPEDYGNLPGAILELNFDNDLIVFTATEVKKKVNAKELKPPTQGKKVTQAQFEEESKELMKNLQMGGGVNFRMGN